MGFWSSLKNIVHPREGSRQDSLEAVERLIGYTFKDRSLLELGLTHRSYVRSGNHHLPSNERLEFLGDSVLGLVVAHQLYRDHPRKREGNLTKTKAMLVNETTLAQVAKEIGLAEHILMSPEEEKTGGRERASILSDAFESVIGAVYLDSGLEAARKLVMRHIYSRKEAIITDISQRNFKGDLLELVQGNGEGMPRYDVISEHGPDHEKTFHVVVKVAGRSIGQGQGTSKKEAEQMAACEAIENYSKESESD